MKKFIFSTIVLFSYTFTQAQNWSLTGNNGTNPSSHFIGTTDNVPITMKVNNILAAKIASNGFVSFGYEANGGVPAGTNTAIGHQALKSTTTGAADWSVAVGYQTGFLTTTAANSTFIGYKAGYGNTTGSNNTAIGKSALLCDAVGFPLTGSDNTAIGANSLRALTQDRGI